MPGIVYDGQYYDKHKRIPKEQSEMDKIQRNWQHRAHKMEKTKAKAQHNMCWKPSQFSQKYCLAYF